MGQSGLVFKRTKALHTNISNLQLTSVHPVLYNTMVGDRMVATDTSPLWLFIDIDEVPFGYRSIPVGCVAVFKHYFLQLLLVMARHVA
ncbi:MAG: hypothetical protein KIY12_10005 [Thermoplasmata archaeon]|uniref:Uncharacterized protein n=1 Tax=Candidatus Sysuiplasma superficiale TaxID=2823368 RepID=A0A8J7YTJ3_9ARCH|nr:hypothetical protein [Candidatus Sysuiplasma superficiale]